MFHGVPLQWLLRKEAVAVLASSESGISTLKVPDASCWASRWVRHDTSLCLIYFVGLTKKKWKTHVQRFFSWCFRRLKNIHRIFAIQPAWGKCHVLAQPMGRWLMEVDGFSRERRWTSSGKRHWKSTSLQGLFCSFYFILWCSTFKCISSKTLDSRLSTSLPGRKRGFSLHLCPDWMIVGSWFEVFKCYSCSWQAETWSGSSVLLSNFSISRQFGTIGHHILAPSTTMGSMMFHDFMTVSPLRSPWICGTGWKSSTKMPRIGTTPLVAWPEDRWIKTPANAPLCYGQRWRRWKKTESTQWKISMELKHGDWEFDFLFNWVILGSMFIFRGVVDATTVLP